jgi:hypothetical protein
MDQTQPVSAETLMTPQDKDENPVFKKGIWIREQQGQLTMGSLDKNDNSVMVLSDELAAKLHTVESDMMDALFGDNRTPFRPGVLDMDAVFAKLKKTFKTIELKLSFADPHQRQLLCAFDPVFTLMENLVASSLSTSLSPVININASVLENHLYIIYRDFDSVSKPSDLAPEFYQAKNRLNANIQFKKTENNRTYYDIMIPLGSES